MVYDLLAAFNVLTVAILIHLNHRSVGLYTRAVEINQLWARSMADYTELGRLAAAVNAPGNDVFESGDVGLESARLERSVLALRQRLSRLRAELSQHGAPLESAALLEDMDAVEGVAEQMAGKSRAIFAHLEKDQRVEAGQRMADMDRSYASLLEALRRLSSRVVLFQAQALARQAETIGSIQRAEQLGAGLIALMLVAAVFYGRKLTEHAERDRRDRQRHLRQLQDVHEERMLAMGSLVAGVAHEVRNPLFGISSTLDAFEARHGGSGEFSRYFTVLKGEVERLRTLMQDLLDYGKPSTLDLAPVDVDPLVDDAVGACLDLARESTVEIAKGRWEPGRARMDRSRILQVLQNLIQNAIQHAPAGTSVLLETGRSLEGGRGRVWISVRDKGPGFAAEELRRAFEPFFTRRPGGTGLGLSIAQRIVAQHEGALSASNHAEGGAIVTVFVPSEGPRGRE